MGRNKALERVGSESLISTVIGRLSLLTDKTVVVVAGPENGAELELSLPPSVETVVDTYPRAGALGGIFTGLSSSDRQWGMVVACDMPFLNLDLLRYMLLVREGYDVVVPMLDGRPEPVHALYSKTCLPHMERQLRARDLKIVRFFNKVRVNYLSQRVVEEYDSERLSFFNVNTQDDLDIARSLIESHRHAIPQKEADGSGSADGHLGHRTDP